MQDDPSLPVLSTSGLYWLRVGILGIVYPLDERTVYATSLCLQDLLTKRSVYQRLGSYPRICQYFSSVQRGILLERFGEPVRKHLRKLYKQGKTPSHKQALKCELFALGSTIYKLWTTTRPYEDEPNDTVEDSYKHQCFPDVGTLPVAEIIKKCWHGSYTSADEVVADLILQPKPTNAHAYSDADDRPT
ncbi:hypothetical protein BU26DRAFT_514307 [Trematosphaeria pertusa]|uniref:Uncharacterized protein n=1 Tax=Trematosphaeria pertusa TaxID=390896 RepID=A0A6A6IUZ1_9PLEO|nr:uncharacterized protein BU26DRAFT_514307 [Trematosphaeria pertusa]KAF2254381.1 hypothetical protein BU26DRAFT_514307 [Trematosphaeria pertusa]